MKEKYVPVEIELVELDKADLICTSGGGCTNEGDSTEPIFN